MAWITLSDSHVQYRLPLCFVSDHPELPLLLARKARPSLTYLARTIHTLQPNRSELKVLAGPPDNFRLHSLNGHVSTPIFDHLGSSSWHSYDAYLIVLVGKSAKWMIPFLILGAAGVVYLVARICGARGPRRRYPSYKSVADSEQMLDSSLDGRMA